MENNLNDILHHIEDNEHIYIQGKRERKNQVYVDRRYYLIFILAIKYDYSESMLSNLFKLNRSTCYYALEKISYLLKDKVFLDSVEQLLTLFPYSDEDIHKLHIRLKNKREYIKHEDRVSYAVRQVKKEYNLFGLNKKSITKLKSKPNMIDIIKQLIKTL